MSFKNGEGAKDYYRFFHLPKSSDQTMLGMDQFSYKPRHRPMTQQRTMNRLNSSLEHQTWSVLQFRIVIGIDDWSQNPVSICSTLQPNTACAGSWFSNSLVHVTASQKSWVKIYSCCSTLSENGSRYLLAQLTTSTVLFCVMLLCYSAADCQLQKFWQNK